MKTTPLTGTIHATTVTDEELRLEYLREQIQNETISLEEIVELQSLADYIEDNDVLLLEWANVEEGTR